jgi:hypothetical protein
MQTILSLFILLSFPAFAAKVVSFEASKTYQMEGSLKGHFFVFNRMTSNAQLIELKDTKDMVDGAQYSVCLKFTADCHMECKASVVSKPRFITPDISPALLTPDEKGAYAPADKTQCP